VSTHDWPGRDYHFELACARDGCGTLLSECPTWRQALETMIENHDQCRPAVVVITRRGRTVARKRWRWSIWLHCGAEPGAEAA